MTMQERNTIKVNGTDVSHSINLSAVSENAILITWPEKICPRQHQKITEFEQTLKNSQQASLFTEMVSSYNSLIVYYDFFQINAEQMLQRCQQQLVKFLAHSTENTASASSNDSNSAKLIEIPVYYGEQAGLDLASCADALKLTPAQIIHLHSQQEFRAYALGFTPSFCYLGQLPKALQLPRKAMPRAKMPAGAVAIAEQQTAVYPSASPGGWHIIGRTPVSMYQLSRGTNAENQFTPLINVGDRVKFTAIDKATYLELGGNFD